MIDGYVVEEFCNGLGKKSTMLHVAIDLIQ